MYLRDWLINLTSILNAFGTRENRIDTLSLSHPVNSLNTTHAPNIRQNEWKKMDWLGDLRIQRMIKQWGLWVFCLFVWPRILDWNVEKSTKAMRFHIVRLWSHDWVACCVWEAVAMELVTGVGEGVGGFKEDSEDSLRVNKLSLLHWWFALILLPFKQ